MGGIAGRVAATAALAALAFPATAGNIYVPLTVAEPAGVARDEVRATAGVPLPPGRVRSLADLRLLGARSAPSFTALERWPDGSVRWLLAEFAATVPAGGTAGYVLTQDPKTPAPPALPLTVTLPPGGPFRFEIDTGVAVFTVARGGGFRGLDDVRVGVPSAPILLSPGADLVATVGGVTYRSSADPTSTVVVEDAGPAAVTLAASGDFRDAGGRAVLAYRARLHFRAGSGLVRLVLTVKNPAAAGHPGNVWDLGASGRVDLDDLSLELPLRLPRRGDATLAGGPTFAGPLVEDLTVYQESSGGVNWDHLTHVDRTNRVPMTFPGWELRGGASGVMASGLRAAPAVDLSTAESGLGVAVPGFWQNFPKAIRLRLASTVSVGLWPDEFPVPHELQGGEEKTHEVLLDFHPGDAAASGTLARLAAEVEPLRARPAYPEVARSRVLPAFGPRDRTAFPDYEHTIDYIALDQGVRSFFTQREAIDEYGWRHFGEAFADHESACGSPGSFVGPISHDNNQYDYDWAALVQWLRAGEPEWQTLGEQGVRHLMDIDVYHTDADTPAYNRGMFWHTTHDTDAFTSTHRTYSALMSAACTPYLSGGPALEHLYGEGMLLHGYLTGDRRTFEVHAELEGYLATRYALDAPAPGSGYPPRGYANALRTAISGFRRAGDPALHDLARRIVADSDARVNPAMTGTSFGDSMLMVALGRFLDLKVERGERAAPDAVQAYESLRELARRVQSAYAPRQDVLDFRYSEGLWYAYKHAPAGDPEEATWAGLGRAYFEAGERSPWFNTYITNKGLAHVATNGQLHTYFERGRIPRAVTRLMAVKRGSSVELSWDAVDRDVDGKAIALGGYNLHRAARWATRFTDQPHAAAAPAARGWTGVGDVADPEPRFFYEVRAVAERGIEGL